MVYHNILMNLYVKFNYYFLLTYKITFRPNPYTNSYYWMKGYLYGKKILSIMALLNNSKPRYAFEP